MAIKKEVKQTEARILVYLSQVPNESKSLDLLSARLDIDYSYCIRTLKRMILKGWIFKHPFQARMYYDNTPSAPIDKAKESLCPEELQKVLDLSVQTDLGGK